MRLLLPFVLLASACLRPHPFAGAVDDGAVDDGTSVDAVPDAPPLVPFGMPVLVGGVLMSAQTDDDATISTGERPLFSSSRSGEGDIYSVTRMSTTDIWMGLSSSTLTNINTTNNNENTPRLSADGRTLFYSTEPGYDIYMATRQTLTDPWSAGAPVTPLNTGSREAEAVMTDNGLAIYFSSNRDGNQDQDLYFSTRGSPSGTWSMPIAVSGANSGFSDDSPFTRDGLTLLFSSNRPGSKGGTNLWITTRPTLADSFSPPVPLDELNSDFNEEDPWVSADGHRIWFGSNRGGDFDIYTASR